ncbi:uncharacterized protein LOC118204669 [Stegodyphus dumicola]|uniref:uncharacterized protein LOC118204669 n=1 Tax=Stegodyphus dumicola TaxID=202533 RepID=UPI0015B283DA|nr:uncharacterized protein LOC118204669 [Stegodyphus dumicola]
MSNRVKADELSRNDRVVNVHQLSMKLCSKLQQHAISIDDNSSPLAETDSGTSQTDSGSLELGSHQHSIELNNITETPKRLKCNKNLTPKSLKIRQLSHKLAYLKRKHSAKRKANKAGVEKALQLISSLVSSVVFTFIKSQIKASNVSKYGRRWSLMDKNLCLQIYLSSPKSYNTLKAFLHLPSKPTLLKAVSGIKMEPGFSVAVLNAIKLVASKLKIHDRYCILSFDEITLKQSLSYDKKSDYIVGFENYGSYTELKMFPEYATHGLVFMVRGLCKKWKQVIGYFFSSHTTPGFMLCTLVMEALSKLFDCGLIPVAVVCDGGANNVVCYKKFMKVTEERPYIICQDKKVFTLFDVPHLLKCLRNNFRKYDVKFQGGKIASWNHIVSLWEFDRKMPHRCVPKLTDRHVNVDCLSAMSVKLAAQVFSHSVASGLCYLSALNGLPASASLTADFCSNINILFDSLNSRTLKHSNPFLAGVPYLN